MIRSIIALTFAACFGLVLHAETVADPADFKRSGGRPLFSGPQSGEKLPPLTLTGIGGKFDGKVFDPIEIAKGKPQLLVLMDDSDVGGKTSYYLDRFAKQVAKNSEGALFTTLVLLGDDPAVMESRINQYRKYVGDQLTIGYSKLGRDGPGNYGLNRQVPVTMIIAKRGVVVHNFAFQNHVFQIDPFMAGAVAEAMNVKRKTMASWLAEADKTKMTTKSMTGAWIGWAKEASPEEVEEALKSKKFRDLPMRDQKEIKEAIQNFAKK